MKAKRTLALMLVAFVMLSVAFAGCSAPSQSSAQESEKQESVTVGEETGSDKLTVGFSLYFRKDQFWKDLESVAVAKAEANGIELICQDADTDSEKQVQQLETFVAQKVDAIILAPVDPEAPISVIAEAAEAGIPVFTIDTNITDVSNLTSEISHDHYEGAYQLGQKAADFLEENYGGKGKVAIITDPTNIPLRNRTQGFKDALTERLGDNVEFVAELNGKCDRDVSSNCAESVITPYPDTTIWFGTTPDMGFGIIATLETKGIDPNTVAVYSEGWGEETVIALTKDNPYLKTVMVSPADSLADLGLQAIIDYLGGKSVEKKTFIPTDIVDASNAVDYFKKYGVELE